MSKSPLHALFFACFLFSVALVPAQIFAQTDAFQGVSVLAPKDPDLASTRIDSVFVSSQSVVVWGTKKGLYVEQPNGTGQWFNASNAPFTPEMFPCCAIYNGELWTAVRNPAEGQGLFKYDGTSWKKFHPKVEWMLSTLVTCMLVDSKNRFWIGYEERGIDQYIGAYFKTKPTMYFSSIKVKHGLLAGMVTGLVESDNRLWVGSHGGISSFIPKDFNDESDDITFKNWSYPQFPARFVNGIVPFQGKVAASTELGLVVPNGENWKLLGAKDGVNNPPVHALAYDGNRLWFTTSEGIQFYQNGVVSKSYSQLPSKNINCLHATPTANGGVKLYVGTEKGARLMILN